MFLKCEILNISIKTLNYKKKEISNSKCFFKKIKQKN